MIMVSVVIVIALYLLYLIKATPDLSGQGAHLELTRDECVLLSICVVMISALCVMRAILTYNPKHMFQELEDQLTARGGSERQERGLICTLAAQLRLDRPITLKTLMRRDARPHAHGSERLDDELMLTLIARRATLHLRALPSMVKRPPWEFAGLALICGLWLASTVTMVQESSRAEAENSEGRAERASARAAQRVDADAQRSLAQERSSSDRPESSIPGAPNPEVTQALSGAERPLKPRESQPRPSEQPDARGTRRRSSATQDSPNANTPEAIKLKTRRAQRGGRAVRGLTSSPSKTQSLTLNRRSAIIKADRDQQERRASRQRRSTQPTSPLSIAESAATYGVSTDLSPLDFPPHLRAHLNAYADEALAP